MRSDRRFLLISIVVACGCCALAAYAAATRASGLMMADAKDTRRAVLKRVPAGSAPAMAQAVMEADGFACTQMTHAPYSVTDTDSGNPVLHEAADFLSCDSGARGFIITKRWQVMFIEKAGSVSSVVVNADVGRP